MNRAEKQLKDLMMHFSACKSQAMMVKENMDTVATWKWIKATEHYEPFDQAYQKFTGVKNDHVMIQQLLIDSTEFGHLGSRPYKTLKFMFGHRSAGLGCRPWEHRPLANVPTT